MVKKRVFSILTYGILFLLVLQISSAQDYSFETSSKQPTIIVEFQEESLITSHTLTDPDNIELDQPTVSTEDNYTYRFTPISPLAEGLHILTVQASDILGNPSEEPVIITINITPMSVFLIKPALGISNTSTFDILLGTSEDANCRYDSFPPATRENYDDLLNEFESITMRVHKLSQIEAPEFPGIIPAYVICKTPAGDLSEIHRFNFSYDDSPPIISSVTANPSTVVQLDELGDKSTIVTAQIDDPSICRYDDTENRYHDMATSGDNLEDGVFDNTDELSYPSYTTSNTKLFNGLRNGETYIYHISCMNLAGLTSSSKDISFNVNLGAEMGITYIFPTDGSAKKDKDIDLTIRVNKRADTCYYDDEDVNTESPTMDYMGQVDSLYEYNVFVGQNQPDKEYTYNFLCKTATQSARSSTTFIIDNTQPTCEKPEVDEYTWSLDILEAEFECTDEESGVDLYNYTITDFLGKTILEWTTTDDTEVEAEDLNLSDGRKYRFSVKARNRAGIWSSKTESNYITVDLSRRPRDDAAPNVTLDTLESPFGVNVSLICTDLGTIRSGCDISNMKIGTGTTKLGCVPNDLYNDTLTITEDSYVCWSVSDRAGNIDEDSQLVTMPDFIDIDMDNVSDSIDECPNTPFREDVNNVGCSCSQKDDDNDNLNNCIDECPDTSPAEIANSKGCGPSQFDTDKDGMPDKWEDDNGFDKNDPSDGMKDPDRDGLYNSDEYLHSTDPNIYDTDGDGVADGGERTSNTTGNDPYDVPTDNDNDGIDDEWEISHGLDPSDPTDALQDADEDGLTNLMEYNYNTDPGNEDTDGDTFLDGGEVTSETNPRDPDSKPLDEDDDGMDDVWELFNGLDPNNSSDADKDADEDGISNFQEYLRNTDPQNKDTDEDGMDDAWEITHDLNPTFDDSKEDADKDKYTNIQEYNGGTDPRDPTDFPKGLDSDEDGIPDAWEADKGLDPFDPSDANKDQDNDGLLAIEEYTLNRMLDPLKADTDNDGFDDNSEIEEGTDPTDALDFPKGSFISYLLLILLIILILTAAGYYGYSYYKKQKQPKQIKQGPSEETKADQRLREYVKKHPGTKKQIKPIEKKRPLAKKPLKKTRTKQPAEFEKLSRVVDEDDEFSKLEKTTKQKKKQQDFSKLEKLNKRSKKKSDHFSRLDKMEKKDFDRLTALKTKTNKKIDDLAKKQKTEFEKLSKVKGMEKEEDDIFSKLDSRPDEFEEMNKKLGIKTKIPTKKIQTKKDIKKLVTTFQQLSEKEGKKASIDVFKTILSQLISMKKISTKDVTEVLVALQNKKVLTKKDVSDVLFYINKR